MNNIYVDRSAMIRAISTRLVQICNRQRDQGRAMAFAFILYDGSSPQIKQVLEKKDYWESFNYTSGKFLTVYSLCYDEENLDVPKKTKPHIFRVLNDRMDEILKGNFDTSKLNYPCILFFQVDRANVIDTMLVNLEKRGIEESYDEIQSYIEAAVKALKKIDKKYRKNYREIFDSLEREIKHLRSANVMRKNFEKGNFWIGILSGIRGVLGV